MLLEAELFQWPANRKVTRIRIWRGKHGRILQIQRKIFT
jgi:hypothetical protein